MFTGLVQTTGTVRRLDDSGPVRRLAISASLSSERRALGASIAVNGVCLTVVGSDPESVAFDVAFETLQRTTLGSLGLGAAVNLEAALRVGDAIGGHFVSGHVDGVATVRQSEAVGAAAKLWLDLPPELLAFVATKGSICVDGVSLTINDVDARGFSVGLVPHTLACTTLKSLAPGRAANIEVDVLARYVGRWLEARTTASTSSLPVTRELLVAAGFIAGES